MVVPFLRMLNIDLVETGMAVAQGWQIEELWDVLLRTFVSVPREGGGFDHYAIEVNLSKKVVRHIHFDTSISNRRSI